MIDLSRPINLTSADFVNNKYEYYERIREAAGSHLAASECVEPATPGTGGAHGFLNLYVDEVLKLLGLRESWSSVSEIFEVTLGVSGTSPVDSFVALGGDSLSYVEISLALESLIDELPSGWEAMSIDSLEELTRPQAI